MEKLKLKNKQNYKYRKHNEQSGQSFANVEPLLALTCHMLYIVVTDS